MARSVPRIGRVLDIVGAALLLAGAGVYGYAWFGLRALRDFEPAANAETFAAMARYNDLTTFSRVGLGLMAVGAIVALAAAFVARRGRDPAREEDPARENDPGEV